MIVKLITLIFAWTFILTTACYNPAQKTEFGYESNTGQSTWKFAVFGDTRDADTGTKTGISPRLRELAETIASENPDLVLHTGDLINGYYTTSHSPVHGKYEEMLENWKMAVSPIYDFDKKQGIPLFVIRGNHEDGELVTNEDLKKAYLKVIAPLMPQNGPSSEKGLTYSAIYNQAKFIALDEYSIKELGILRGLIDMPWLETQLTENTKLFTFVYGHVPAYRVSSWKAGPFPDLYAYPHHRDAFWESLEKAGVPIYFCGHVHFYSRITKGTVQQVLIGSGGANTIDFDPREADPSVTLNYPQAFTPASVFGLGYMIVNVNEKAGTITGTLKLFQADSGRWEIADNFTIEVNKLPTT